MSINKRTYSPLTSVGSYNTYSYSSTLSPSYSYSRVSSYLDALQKDQTITKLRKQLSDVRSLEMKYNSMMQQINLAEKENQLLQVKNQEIQKQYLQKIKNVKEDIQTLKANLNEAQTNIQFQQMSTKQVQGQIQKLIEELKSIKIQEQETTKQSQKLQAQIQNYQTQSVKMKDQNQSFKQDKHQLQLLAKQVAQKMEDISHKMTSLNQCMQKQQEQIALLNKQIQSSLIQSNNLAIICQKNKALIENHTRRTTIQEGEIQQLKMELKQIKNQLTKCQKNQEQKKDQLYQSIISVQEKSFSGVQTLQDIQKLLTLDNTSKQYFLDLETKLNRLIANNQKLHEMEKHLQGQLHDLQMKEYKLINKAKCNIQADFLIKKLLQNRLQNSKLAQ